MKPSDLTHAQFQRGTLERLLSTAKEVVKKKGMPVPKHMTYDYALHIILNEV